MQSGVLHFGAALFGSTAHKRTTIGKKRPCSSEGTMIELIERAADDGAETGHGGSTEQTIELHGERVHDVDFSIHDMSGGNDEIGHGANGEEKSDVGRRLRGERDGADD